MADGTGKFPVRCTLYLWYLSHSSIIILSVRGKMIPSIQTLCCFYILPISQSPYPNPTTSMPGFLAIAFTKDNR
jgi:hypothetical protein